MTSSSEAAAAPAVVAAAAAERMPSPSPSVPTSAPAMRVPIPPRGVDYRGKVVLAPMVRSGELPARLLALHYGADLVWGPETVDRSMIGTTRRLNPRTHMLEWSRLPTNPQALANNPFVAESVIYRMDPVREAGKLIFQIGTSDPERAVAAARTVAADVAGIDVNAGCPKPFSTTGGMGAMLLQTPEKLASILEALVREITPAFGIGISVKIRLLEEPERTAALVRRLVATGITGLTVHCRTTPMRPRERAIRGQLRMVADICREAGVACVMNGDVENRDTALSLIEEYAVDGAMIATTAEKNSSVFRAGGEKDPWRMAVERYMRYAIEVENKFGNTKFTLTQMIPGKEEVYRELAACDGYRAVVETLGFKGLVEVAAALDKRLRIGGGEKKETKKQAKKRKWVDTAAAEGTSGKKSANNGNNGKKTEMAPAEAVAAIAAGASF
ncbi:putative tRNA dihydrouridine synthase [Cercophora scortea]|uniref:tRNA dihydrouridine synthase n=1 Tax=Cercophora scortea TaxID=314031 RepID=A0AAE0J3J3_9PEZI|nr:putative tRNA dihydrouridine synthase [Cercophora scortea]